MRGARVELNDVVAQQIRYEVTSLRTRNIVQRDLKPSNILRPMALNTAASQ